MSSLSNIDLEKQASNLKAKYGSNTFYTPVIKIANEFGIKVIEGEFKDSNIAGILAIKNNNKQIIINKNDTPTRQRFTIAHELRHYVLGHVPPPDENNESVSIYRNVDHDGKKILMKFKQINLQQCY